MAIEQSMELDVVPQVVPEERLVLDYGIHRFMAEAGMVAQIFEISTPTNSFYEAREIRSIRTHGRVP